MQLQATVSTRHDGSVIIDMPQIGNYEVFRSKTGKTFAQIGKIKQGQQFIDLRPNMNWHQVRPTEARFSEEWHKAKTSNAWFTTQVGASISYTFVGRRIGLLATKLGQKIPNRNQIIIRVYINGRLCEDVDLSIYYPEERPNMIVWGIDCGFRAQRSVTFELIKLDFGKFEVQGFWIDTAEQSIDLNQSGCYFVVDLDRGIRSELLFIKPIFNGLLQLKKLADKLLSAQLSFSENVFPARDKKGEIWASAYPIEFVIEFAMAFYLFREQKYLQAMNRQFTFAKTRKTVSGNILSWDDKSIHPDYDSRYSYECYWLYWFWGEERFLREAENTLEACIKTFGNQSHQINNLTYYPIVKPLTYINESSNLQATPALMFASLWSEPRSRFYIDPTIKAYALNHLALSTSLQVEMCSGEIPDNKIDKHPDGLYSAFALILWNKINKVFRYDDTRPVVQSLQGAIDMAEPWEVKYNREPCPMYSSRSFSNGSWYALGLRPAFSFHEWLKNKLCYQQWVEFYSLIYSAGFNQPYYNDPRGLPESKTLIRNTDTVFLAFSDLLYLGIPQQWWLPIK